MARLNWDRFAVLTIEDFDHFDKNEWEPPQSAFPAETCSRRIYVDLADAHSSPMQTGPNQGDRAKIHLRMDAYSLLVAHYAGIGQTETYVDYHNTKQMGEAWQRYQGKNPERYRMLKPYMDDIFHDGKLIAQTILAPFRRRPTLVSTAVDLAGLSQERSSLLICDNPNSAVEIITEMGQDRPYNPGNIFVTHQNPGTLAEIKAGIHNIPPHRAIKSTLDFIPFDHALERTFFETHAILVCHPMAGIQDNETDLNKTNQRLRELWRKKNKKNAEHNARMVCIKANPYRTQKQHNPRPKNRNNIQKPSTLPGFIPYAFVDNETTKRMEQIQQAMATAKLAISRMAGFRGNNQRIREIRFDPNDMSVDYVVTRPPLGYDPKSSPASTAQGNHLSA